MGKVMKQVVAIANDHAGVALKKALLPTVRECGFEPLDLGTDSEDSVDYPDFGMSLAKKVVGGEAQFGIAICGSGIGIAIAANRVPRARAALVHTVEEAKLARQHNDANIIVFGARLIELKTAQDCLRSFLATEFEGGRHSARVAKLG